MWTMKNIFLLDFAKYQSYTEAKLLLFESDPIEFVLNLLHNWNKFLASEWIF